MLKNKIILFLFCLAVGKYMFVRILVFLVLLRYTEMTCMSTGCQGCPLIMIDQLTAGTQCTVGAVITAPSLGMNYS